MVYIPNTDADRRKMLDRIGVTSFDELLTPIPENLRLKETISLPEPLSELELLRQIEHLSRKNRSDLVIFAGGGVYDHFIPAVVSQIIGRPEFATAYTPYQAEVAQGTLQVIYEYQTHICRLTGMDVANASMYDGASAAAEAARLSMAKTGRNKIVISETVSPLYREVTATYLSGQETELMVIPRRGGKTDFDRVVDAVDDSVSCIILAQPNFFGLLEDIDLAAELIHRVGGHLVLAVDPIAAAVLRTPADYGADIVVGEGQPLGLPLNFGGPLLGIFAVKKELIRLLPGRLAGRTVDLEGNTGFVLTLQTREQHIRRDRATSNICTSQALCATAATVYLSLMGRQGLKKVALLSMDKTYRSVRKICKIDGFEPYFKGDFVREVAVKTPVSAKALIEKMVAEKAILPGVNLGRFYADMDDGLLVAATEKRTEDEIDAMIKALQEYTSDAVLSKV
ncbi:MAG: aminomethyl-transferring glycine dehydrogenase subunit GcvPA [Candidatus Zixiibacteriota bacterium]|nr:MAG: aminomethyl-transferring glycine dehydrogenase subunit GcvPA [candidate division Zixibacteria bacterium]